MNKAPRKISYADMVAKWDWTDLIPTGHWVMVGGLKVNAVHFRENKADAGQGSFRKLIDLTPETKFEVYKMPR